MIADHQQRQLALDPSQSFIVQAPAGSGKTDILTKRYLTLLTTVKAPEEVIAITFTRKAAYEMRKRIIDALHKAQHTQSVTNEHEQQLLTIAQNVLRHQQQHQWQITQNPNRLRILTIDAFCANLVRQMPISAQFGAMPNVTEKAYPLYQQAVRQVLTDLEEQSPWDPALQYLLQHVDNNHSLLEQLLIDMLARRDQWLHHLTGIHDKQALRQHLEQALQNVITHYIKQTYQILDDDTWQRLASLAHFAANNLINLGSDSPITACANIIELNTQSSLATWQGIATLLLTKTQYQFRKTLNKNAGFPAASDLEPALKTEGAQLKQTMLEYLKHFSDNEKLRESLQNILEAPPAHYRDEQWQVIDALITLLPVLAAQLMLEFKDSGQVDFIEIASRALFALGDDDEPTSLALSLDYRIQHILVDEFQDTSSTQYRLLERLTNHWQEDDGKTLFLVGDPMQSIYRFREAEVGLFLRARAHGLANIKLTPLTLKVNFRSQAAIIDWVNQYFTHIFPLQNDMSAGAISYHASQAHHPVNTQYDVNYHTLFNATRTQVAKQLISTIKTLRQADAHASIAILIRARTHITPLLPFLRQANITVSALEIESLATRVVIQDLYALTRALIQLADRSAWLAILRAPWCGLSLHDLHIIAANEKHHTLWDRIQQFNDIKGLSVEGKQRLARCYPIFQNALKQRQRSALSQLVHSTWLALGGPACCQHQYELNDANTYFQALEKLARQHPHFDHPMLEQTILALFANVETSDEQAIHVMTMHKAKGLEFDHVIILGLEHKPPVDSNNLLLWEERPNEMREITDLLLAPIKASFEEDDKIYRFLRRQEQRRLHYETARLFYVACTRAKKSLHLLANLKADQKGLKKPISGSLLALLWPQLSSYYQQQWRQENDNTPVEDSSSASAQQLKRLTLDWQLPIAIAPIEEPIVTNSATKPSAAVHIDDEQDQQARHVGILAHRLLCQLAEGNIVFEKLNEQRSRWQMALRQFGMNEHQASTGCDKLLTCLHNCLADERGQWILSDRHQFAENEYALTVTGQSGINIIIIDRTFVDDNNVRWIIDYKTSSPHPQQSITDFLSSEKHKYSEQLTHYANAMSLLDSRTIKLGLYFPMISQWCDWEHN